jgi:hypothetical protein
MSEKWCVSVKRCACGVPRQDGGLILGRQIGIKTLPKFNRDSMPRVVEARMQYAWKVKVKFKEPFLYF